MFGFVIVWCLVILLIWVFLFLKVIIDGVVCEFLGFWIIFGLLFFNIVIYEFVVFKFILIILFIIKFFYLIIKLI